MSVFGVNLQSVYVIVRFKNGGSIVPCRNETFLLPYYLDLIVNNSLAEIFIPKCSQDTA